MTCLVSGQPLDSSGPQVHLDALSHACIVRHLALACAGPEPSDEPHASYSVKQRKV